LFFKVSIALNSFTAPLSYRCSGVPAAGHEFNPILIHYFTSTWPVTCCPTTLRILLSWKMRMQPSTLTAKYCFAKQLQLCLWSTSRYSHLWTVLARQWPANKSFFTF